MWSRYAWNALGNRLSSQVISLMPSGAPAGASFISAMQRTSVVLGLCGMRCGRPVRPARRASGLLVFADQQRGVGQVHVWRHLEVVGRWLVLEHAARQVERGTVARAQETADPVVGQ